MMNDDGNGGGVSLVMILWWCFDELFVFWAGASMIWWCFDDGLVVWWFDSLKKITWWWSDNDAYSLIAVVTVVGAGAGAGLGGGVVAGDGGGDGSGGGCGCGLVDQYTYKSWWWRLTAWFHGVFLVRVRVLRLTYSWCIATSRNHMKIKLSVKQQKGGSIHMTGHWLCGCTAERMMF